MKTPMPLVLSRSETIEAPLARVYAALVNPAEQMRWNTLYLEAALSPPGPVKNGSVMTGRFKGSGRARVEFQQVVFEKEFTHHSRMTLFQSIPLGDFFHTYQVEPEPQGTGTRVTQKVRFLPSGLGRLLKKVLMNAFEKRLPDSFKELNSYLRG